MAVDVMMPKLGVEMEKGRILEWKKEEGEWVEKEKPLLVIETEKVAYEMQSPASGFVHIVVAVDCEVPVGQRLAVLAESREEYGQIAAREAVSLAAGSISVEEAAISSSETEAAGRVRSSPLARRLAEEQGIDIATIEGTGPQGRITKDDVLRAAEQRQTAALMADKKETPAIASEIPVARGKRVKAAIPLKGMRRVIAERMLHSLQSSAQMTDFGDIDMTEMVGFRQQVNAQLRSSGVCISYPAIFVKAVSVVLKEQPIMNSSLVGDEIKMWEDINIGVAVALEDGLMVPVVHQADKLSFLEINRALKELVDKVRTRTIMPDELGWGTFTVTNVGSYGSDAGTAVLNPPEVAILVTGRISKRPAVVNDEIVVRHMMNYALTVDHRVIDGAVGGRFIQRFRQLMENPGLLALY
ncbi:MAG: 2-oxo acid dehydrogenase subunit E2 [Chloroflexi bacterium]|nr:2-oxo acid dehydrogenase subunit E2 [Chloroflexota bacterium]